MSIDDLNLEFEDEEVGKKTDAVAVDLDLEFTGNTQPAPANSRPAVVTKTVAKPLPQVNAPSSAVVQKEIKATVNATPESAPPKSSESNVRPMIAKVETAHVHAAEMQIGSSALKIDPHLEVSSHADQEVIRELQQKIEKVEIDAQIKVAVAEFKTDILSDLLSDIKLLEHQVGGLLSRIHQKHPDLKQEALMIKKLLFDFSQKKRK